MVSVEAASGKSDSLVLPALLAVAYQKGIALNPSHELGGCSPCRPSVHPHWQRVGLSLNKLLPGIDEKGDIPLEKQA